MLLVVENIIPCSYFKQTVTFCRWEEFLVILVELLKKIMSIVCVFRTKVWKLTAKGDEETDCFSRSIETWDSFAVPMDQKGCFQTPLQKASILSGCIISKICVV